MLPILFLTSSLTSGSLTMQFFFEDVTIGLSERDSEHATEKTCVFCVVFATGRWINSPYVFARLARLRVGKRYPKTPLSTFRFLRHTQDVFLDLVAGGGTESACRTM